jgi:hypothetical protein
MKPTKEKGRAKRNNVPQFAGFADFRRGYADGLAKSNLHL